MVTQAAQNAARIAAKAAAQAEEERRVVDGYNAYRRDWGGPGVENVFELDREAWSSFCGWLRHRGLVEEHEFKVARRIRNRHLDLVRAAKVRAEDAERLAAAGAAAVVPPAPAATSGGRSNRTRRPPARLRDPAVGAAAGKHRPNRKPHLDNSSAMLVARAVALTCERDACRREAEAYQRECARLVNRVLELELKVVALEKAAAAAAAATPERPPPKRLFADVDELAAFLGNPPV